MYFKKFCSTYVQERKTKKNIIISLFPRRQPSTISCLPEKLSLPQEVPHRPSDRSGHAAFSQFCPPPAAEEKGLL